MPRNKQFAPLEQKKSSSKSFVYNWMNQWEEAELKSVKAMKKSSRDTVVTNFLTTKVFFKKRTTSLELKLKIFH